MSRLTSSFRSKPELVANALFVALALHCRQAGYKIFPGDLRLTNVCKEKNNRASRMCLRLHRDGLNAGNLAE